MGCRKVCPRGSNQEREREMRSMVGLRGTVQIRHTRQSSVGCCHGNMLPLGPRAVLVQCGLGIGINGGMELG